MGLSSAFKQIWWALLVILTGLYLYARADQLIAGKPTYFDVVAFIVWIGVCLAPIFSEIKIFGLELKQEIAELKRDLSQQINLMKMELKTSIAVSSSSNSQVFVGGNPIPPTDAELPNLKRKIQEALAELGMVATKHPPPQEEDVTDTMIELLKVRLSFEKVISNYARSLGVDARRQSVGRLIREMVKDNLIRSEVARGIMEIMSICNYAVHGEDVTSAQVAFVRDSAPGLLAAIENNLAVNNYISSQPAPNSELF
jgi:hypothetical protein